LDSGDVKFRERCIESCPKGSYVYVQRTLDESYYLGLDKRQLEEREKRQQQARPKQYAENTVLVSQLWLWKINNVIITALPRHEQYKPSHLFDHTLSTFREMNTEERQAFTGDDLAAWILSESVHRLEYPCMADLKEPIFYTIGKRTANILDRLEAYIDDVKHHAFHCDDEAGFIREISETRSKLVMIKNILQRQEEVWNTFCQCLGIKIPLKICIFQTITRTDIMMQRPEKDFARFRRRAERIDEDIARVENLMVVQLDLKSKHQGLREARNSRYLNSAVMGFAIITLIFAPLSFFSSLFALPIDQFARHQNSQKQYSKGYVGMWMSTCFLPFLMILR
jgi:predicted GIY-YIG superfamily endonuclease